MGKFRGKTKKNRNRTRRRFKGGLSATGRSRKKRSSGGRKKKSRKNIGGASLYFAFGNQHMIEAAKNKAWALKLVDKKRKELHERLHNDKPLVDPPSKPVKPIAVDVRSAEEQQAAENWTLDFLMDSDSDDEDFKPLKDHSIYKKYLDMLDKHSLEDVEAKMIEDKVYFTEVLKMDREKEPGENPYLIFDGTYKPMDKDEDRIKAKDMYEKKKAEEAKWVAEQEKEQAIKDAKKVKYDAMSPEEKNESDINDICEKYYNELIDMAQHNTGKFQKLLAKHNIRDKDAAELDEHVAARHGDF